jgi:hypothetical protein
MVPTPLGKTRKQSKHRIDPALRRFTGGSRQADPQILRNRQAREDVLALRHIAHAAARDLARP